MNKKNSEGCRFSLSVACSHCRIEVCLWFSSRRWGTCRKRVPLFYLPPYWTSIIIVVSWLVGWFITCSSPVKWWVVHGTSRYTEKDSLRTLGLNPVPLRVARPGWSVQQLTWLILVAAVSPFPLVSFSPRTQIPPLFLFFFHLFSLFFSFISSIVALASTKLNNAELSGMRSAARPFRLRRRSATKFQFKECLLESTPLGEFEKYKPPRIPPLPLVSTPLAFRTVNPSAKSKQPGFLHKDDISEKILERKRW